MARPKSALSPDEAAVLVCSACGKGFRYDQGYTGDPNQHAPDRGQAVFHDDCAGEPVLSVLPEVGSGLKRFLFMDTDKARVYAVTLDKKRRIPAEIAHQKARVEEAGA
mgnify:FL=1